MMKHEKLFEHNGLFNAKVPRYTSYPPANRFYPIKEADQVLDWLRGMPEKMAPSFYIHIPFCKRLCWFCACRTQGSTSVKPVENYLDHLLREIDQKADVMPQGTQMSRLHLGGGTPTILPPEMAKRLLNHLTEQFPLAQGAEFSVEIDPTDCDASRIEQLAELGMNRASIGVQDFDPQVQVAIGRQQTVSDTRFCVDHLRQSGVQNINIDILYGLPFQTIDSLLATLDKVLGLAPDRIAAFGYAHVPWMSRRQKMIPEAALPDTRARLKLFQTLAQKLQEAGYIQIGIDHFVKPDDGLAQALKTRTLHRNFQGYTDDQSPYLIGFGASAISKYPQGYLQNATSTARYLDDITQKRLLTQRGIILNERDKTLAKLIETLMCYGSIEPADLQSLSLAERAFAQKHVSKLAQRFGDITDYQDGRLQVHPHAYPLLRVVAAALDTPEVRDFSSSNAI